MNWHLKIRDYLNALVPMLELRNVFFIIRIK
jgi:hypothetical protein